MTKFKSGIRSTRRAVMMWQGFMYESSLYFGGGHIMLLKSEFPELYKIWKTLGNKLAHKNLPDNNFANLKKFEKETLFKFNPHTTKKLRVIGDIEIDTAEINIKYYWLICEYLTCELWGNKSDKPFIIKRNNKNVGFLMGMRVAI